jgi:acyl-CoA reductase-like NAD-dependent aldehyde dehydrogenase
VQETTVDTTTNRDIQAETRSVAVSEELGPPVLPFVDGRANGGHATPSQLIDPATGQSFAQIRMAQSTDVDEAVDSSARTLALWRNSPFAERGRALRKLAALIYEKRQAIAQLISREQGKPFLEALTLEVLPALDHLKFLIRHAEKYHGGLAVDPRHPFYAHKRAHYLYDALGVVALVTPSPLPFAIPLIQVGAALAMGNAVVLKPSERTPLSSLRIGELCLQAGFPAGLVNVLPARVGETLLLVAHPKVDKVFVTGGLDAGQSVMATAGCAPRPVVLSLGDKHATIVAGDAEVERSARGVVWGALANCGQNCGSIERVYVEERVASRFLERVLAEVDRLKLGGPFDEGVDIGPLMTEERRQEVHRQVTEAIDAGAKLMRGGVLPVGPGFFYPPTVLLDPPPDCRLMKEETAGPVIPIVVVESLERAILLANDSDYALSASGWTTSPEAGGRLMVALHAGVVTVNDVLYSFAEPAATWSGYKRSGMGQNHGRPGLREMSRQKFVSFDPHPNEGPVFSYPYDATAMEIVETSMDHLHDPAPMGRFKALGRLLRIERFRARVPVRRMLFQRKRQDK